MRKFVFAVQILILYLSMTTEAIPEKSPVVPPLPPATMGIFIDAPEPEGL